MQALRFHASAPRYLLAGALGKRAPVGLAPLRLERLPLPVPPADWRPIDVRLAGVCGSDLSLLFGKNSPRISGFFSFPAVLGHEILGETDGSRVVIDPMIACRERAVEACGPCRRGDDHLCLNIAEGSLAPGIIGFNRDLPGGWGESLVAHESRVHPVGNGVPDERAVLAEPFAVAWRGARVALAGRGGEHDAPRRLLVIGSGSIGLASVAALRHAGFDGELHALGRYPDQRDAVQGMGADRVHGDVAAASSAVGAKSYASIIGPPAWRGGFDTVIDAAGSRSSLDAAMWAAREGGTVVLLGAPGSLRHDFSPHWFRELTLVGSYVYTSAEFAEAVSQLASVAALDRIAVSRYPLARHRRAITDLRARRALKVVFEPQE